MECYNTAPRGASGALTQYKQELTHLENTGEKLLGREQAFGTCDTIFYLWVGEDCVGGIDTT